MGLEGIAEGREDRDDVTSRDEHTTAIPENGLDALHVLEGVVGNDVLDRLRRVWEILGASGAEIAGHSSLRGETAGDVGIFRKDVDAGDLRHVESFGEAHASAADRTAEVEERAALEELAAGKSKVEVR